MGNKDNWYLLYSIQIPSIFAFNIRGVQHIQQRIQRIQNVLNTYSTYSKRTQRIQRILPLNTYSKNL